MLNDGYSLASNKHTSMNYNQIFERNRLLGLIPLNEKVPAPTATAVILLQVAYNNKVKEFEDFMQEALNKMKPDGFDERWQALVRMDDVDRKCKEHEADPEKPEPTEEELAKAEETRQHADEYRKEYEDLNKRYMEAREKKGTEEVKGFDPTPLTRDEYNGLVNAIGVAGDITLDGIPNPVPKLALMRLIAENFM